MAELNELKQVSDVLSDEYLGVSLHCRKEVVTTDATVIGDIMTDNGDDTWSVRTSLDAGTADGICLTYSDGDSGEHNVTVVYKGPVTAKQSGLEATDAQCLLDLAGLVGGIKVVANPTNVVTA
jgi:hypothetical protein